VVGIRAWLLAGFALAMLAGSQSYAAPSGKPVPTETIIVPGTTEPIMPAIPAPGIDETTPTTGNVAPEAPPESEPGPLAIPAVEYDPAKLPAPVKRLREQIIDAAKSGDPEKLRPIIDANDQPPEFSSNEIDDPIAYLKSLAGDPEGREILAILIEVLEAGYVHVDAGTPEEMFIWPYFARYPVDKLTGPQIVELFKIVFAGDYEDMKTYGTYISYRIGLSPDGRWSFFLVGD
jgi:hypothetical protein